MAANKFATMLHRKTNKMSVIIVYTALEWTLIALLLLNALLSYLATKFAAFFGLKPPCIFCTRVDHVLEPGQSYRDLLCDAHAAEVSRLCYCSHHLKLAEASDMCEDCSSSRPAEADRSVAVLSWMKRSEAGEKDLRCSCCGVILESEFFSPYLVLKPSWSASEITQKGNSMEESLEGLNEGEALGREGDDDEGVVSSHCGDRGLEGEGERDAFIPEQDQEGKALFQSSNTCVEVEDASLEAITVCSENILDEGRLISLELIDIATLAENFVGSSPRREDDGELEHNSFERDSTGLIASPVSMSESKDRGSSQILEIVDIIEEYQSVPPAEESSGDCLDYFQCVVPEAIPAMSQDGVDVEVEALAAGEDSGEIQASEDDSKAMDGDANCEISIGSEICDQEQIDQSLCHVSISVPVDVEVQCVENYDETTDKDHVIEIQPVETIVRGTDHISLCTELNEVEEERMPETPTSIDGIHALHRRFFFERRECGTESVDGSVASEIEGSDTLNMDGLKSALRSERKALSALYAELEEERSASAIAANQTMAMITRLQEEKAAMQMEALQYQRMMDEQAEYDQEALQLLNELMMKREKEKQDLEKELEMYRKKVLLYEAKERRKIARSKANGRSEISSASSSGAEDSDGLSFDFHDGNDCFNSLNESNQNTPTDSVLSSGALPETAKHLSTVDESLTDFEEERLSIVEQLKALEEKLFTLDNEEPSNNLEATGHFSEENGHGLNGDYEASCNYENGIENGFSHGLDTNGNFHCERRSMGCRGKRLLPLFDSISMENEDGLRTEQVETDTSPESVYKLTIDHKKLAIAGEVDNVYERLQALEADREFFKHCIGSLKKGDKGMDLLQEILQHLRDLRNVELRVRDAGDELASLSD